MEHLLDNAAILASAINTKNYKYKETDDYKLNRALKVVSLINNEETKNQGLNELEVLKNFEDTETLYYSLMIYQSFGDLFFNTYLDIRDRLKDSVDYDTFIELFKVRTR